jgi:hypothetical protein
MLETILGGLTGLLGSIVTGFLNYKTLKVKNEHEEKMVALETAAMKEEAKMQIAIKKAEIEGEVELADAQAYIEGQKAGNQKAFSDQWIDKLFSIEGKLRFVSTPAALLLAMAFGFVDFLRGLMRPGLTLYLTGMTTVITWMAWDIMQKHGLDTMTVQQAIDIYHQVITIVIYLTVTCICWWFADRRMAKFLTTLNNPKIEEK